jgi:aryl-alcohol dehydrogenase-like predicted oxidoreductase
MSVFAERPGVPGGRNLGLGGFHVGKIADPDLAIEVVHHAVDSGFAVLDNSWDYLGGESERRVGAALAGGDYRERVLVMTKVDSRSYDGVMRQFSESLERLGLDRVDLLQLHEVIRPGDGEDAIERGGLRAMVALQEQGAVGHIGVTGHKDPRYLIDIIERAAAAGIRIETAQMPINAADTHPGSFTNTSLPFCVDHGIEVLGMKPLGAGDLLADPSLSAPELLRWALGQPTAVVVTGCMSMADVDQAVRARDTFTPMSDEERADLERRAAVAIARGSVRESYEVTVAHDSTSRHPEWLA